VIDLCAANDIRPDIEIVPVTDIHKVFTKLDQNNDTGRDDWKVTLVFSNLTLFAHCTGTCSHSPHQCRALGIT